MSHSCCKYFTRLMLLHSLRNWNRLIRVKWSLYRPVVAQRVGRGIALLFHDRGTRRGWVVSSTPRPHFTPGKDTVPILQEAGWAPGPVWTGGKSRPHRDSIPDRPPRSQSLYRLSYRAHINRLILHIKELSKVSVPLGIRFPFMLRTVCNICVVTRTLLKMLLKYR